MIVLRASLVLGRSSHPTQVIQSPAVAWLEVLQGTTEKRHRQKEDGEERIYCVVQNDE